MVAVLPKKLSAQSNRAFPRLDDVQGQQSPQKLAELQGFVNSGAFAQALQQPGGGNAQLVNQLLQRLAQNSSGTGGAFGGNSGFDPLGGNALSSANRFSGLANDSGLGSLAGLGGGGGFFEDRVFGLMVKVVEDMQKQVEERLNALQAQAQAAEANPQDKGGESRNIEFEKIKNDMQKLSQMQQAMSNVLNSMDELAKNAIHHIKAG